MHNLMPVCMHAHQIKHCFPLPQPVCVKESVGFERDKKFVVGSPAKSECW